MLVLSKTQRHEKVEFICRPSFAVSILQTLGAFLWYLNNKWKPQFLENKRRFLMRSIATVVLLKCAVPSQKAHPQQPPAERITPTLRIQASVLLLTTGRSNPLGCGPNPAGCYHTEPQEQQRELSLWFQQGTQRMPRQTWEHAVITKVSKMSTQVYIGKPTYVFNSWSILF